MGTSSTMEAEVSQPVDRLTRITWLPWSRPRRTALRSRPPMHPLRTPSARLMGRRYILATVALPYPMAFTKQFQYHTRSQATPAFSLLPSHHYFPPEALKHRARGPRHPSNFLSFLIYAFLFPLVSKLPFLPYPASFCCCSLRFLLSIFIFHSSLLLD